MQRIKKIIGTVTEKSRDIHKGIHTDISTDLQRQSYKTPFRVQKFLRSFSRFLRH